MGLAWKSGLKLFAAALLACGVICPGQSPSPPPGQQPSGNVTGTVVDRSGAVVAGARLQLTAENQTAPEEVTSGSNGQFAFSGVRAGRFQLTVTSSGFATQAVSGEVRTGETCIVPPIVLDIAAAKAEVQAAASTVEIAQEQIKIEEQQRVLRVIPNYYVTYIRDAAPLNSRQKFELAWKTLADPFSFAAVGVVAGVQQARNNFPGFGQGAAGYARRYGASFGDFVSETFIGGAILPSLLKQDPRYFYKGMGSKRSRTLYALASTVICKGDNGRWQPNYSSILGTLVAGGISNLYYPAEDRNGAKLTFENAAIGMAGTGALNIMEEFFVRRFTRPPKQPANRRQ